MFHLKSAPLRGLLLLLALPLLFTACATKPQVKGLTARLIAVAPVPGEADAYLLTMEYYNDNLSPIGLSRSQHRLQLAGISTGRLDSTAPLALPPLSTGRQDLVLRVDQPELRARLANLGPDDRITYRLNSTMVITVGSNDLRSVSDSDGMVGLTR
jgi:LEA14-like dessication related protein